MYRYHARGRDLYGASYGSFASARLARAAATELPPELGLGKPWARRFGDIQALLSKQ